MLNRTLVADVNGAVVATNSYDAFGNNCDELDQQPFQYTGREWGQETGLYYYRTRYCGYEQDRFISNDPLVQKFMVPILSLNGGAIRMGHAEVGGKWMDGPAPPDHS
jgi:RHS repeat-associated protein